MTRRLVFALAVVAAAARPAPIAAQDADPFLWLENVEGERALEWVKERNERTLSDLSTHPAYQPIHDRILSIYNSRDRIAFPNIMGERLYNFWQDDTHQRGIWRRTTWESYLSGTPRWETILDIDALARAYGWTEQQVLSLPPLRRAAYLQIVSA